MNSSISIKTATGVDLAFKIAGPGARSYAYIIDWHIRLLISATLFLVLSLLVFGGLRVPFDDAEERRLFSYLVVSIPTAVYLFYHPVLEFLTKGRTPGKRLAGIRIVTASAEVPSAMAILTRNVLRLVDSLPFAYGLGLCTAFVTPSSVRIGDLAAGTLLVYETDDRGRQSRSGQLSSDAIEAHGVEVAELGLDLLERWDTIEPLQRSELAVRLLARLAPDYLPDADPHLLHDKLTRVLSDDAAESESTTVVS